MTRTEMEDAIKNLDRRLVSVEQILPTLATKDDLFATRADLHAEIVATRRDLTERIEKVKRHTDVRIEDAREDIRKVAEGVASLSTSLQANTRLLENVVQRLGRHETVLEVLVKRGN